MYLSVYLSICLSIYQSIHPSIYLSIYLSRYWWLFSTNRTTFGFPWLHLWSMWISITIFIAGQYHLVAVGQSHYSLTSSPRSPIVLVFHDIHVVSHYIITCPCISCTYIENTYLYFMFSNDMDLSIMAFSFAQVCVSLIYPTFTLSHCVCIYIYIYLYVIVVGWYGL